MNEFYLAPKGQNTGEINFSQEEISAWRREFPVLGRVNHMANCSQGPQSLEVRAALEEYLEGWNNTGMDWDQWCKQVDLAKAEFARMIGAAPDEIAVSTSVSEIIASVASALPRGGKKKVVTTEAEFPTVGQVWLGHQQQGFAVDFIPVRNGVVELEEYEKHIDEQTLLASVTHVYYQTSFKQDLAAISRICHRRGVPLLVDAYQSLGTVDLNVKQLGIDMLCSGNLKYLLGVPGIAFLYVNRDLADQLNPAATGWFGQANPFDFTPRQLAYAPGARRFDTGTPPVAAAYGAGAGMALLNRAGLPRIQRRLTELSQFTLDKAQELGLPLLSPLDTACKGVMTAIEVPGDSHRFEEQLKARGILVSARGNAIRLAPHFFSLPEEIAAALAELRNCLA